MQRFCEEKFSLANIKAIRESLKLGEKARVILFVGRISEAKGIDELLISFKNLLMCHAELVLLIVGPFEHKLERTIRAQAQQLAGNKVIFTGYSSEPEQFMAVADVLCIPSYREGFGTVVIEAAAMAVPAVGTKIYGLTDAIVDGETGLLVELKNVIELTQALQKLIDNEPLRKRLGKNAKKRALKEFDSKHCGELLVREYEELLK